MARHKTRVLTCNRWSPKGEAMAGDGKKTAVWRGIVGEEARVQITRRGANRDYGEVDTPLTPSSWRVEPPCERMDSCGGCAHMHLNAAGQHEAKRWLIADAFRAEGLDGVPVEAMVGSPLQDYRHVIKLIASVGDRGRPRLGAPARFTRRIVPIPKCNVVTPGLRDFTGHAAHKMFELELRPFTEETGGLFRYIHARESRHSGEILVTVVATRENGLIRKYCEELAHGPVSGVHLHVHNRRDNTIFDRDDDGCVHTKRIWGRQTLTESLLGVKLSVGPTDFFQTNPAMAEKLYAYVAELSGASEGVPILDLYCGVGGFALALAPRTGWALGIESNATSVERAIGNARLAGVHAEFIRGAVCEALIEQKPVLKDLRPVVIVDPARRGLEQGVGSAILDLRPRRVIYVSCNARGLARDLRNFLARGFELKALRPFDMFPNTPHIEVVALLEPTDAGEEPVRRPPRRKMVS